MEINLTKLHISKDVMEYLKFTLITFDTIDIGFSY